MWISEVIQRFKERFQDNSLKRDRDVSDDDPPIMKRYKTVKSHFPKIMPSDEEEEGWVSLKKQGRDPRVCYIPISKEYIPSTSTPAAGLPQISVPSTSSATKQGLIRNSDPLIRKYFARSNSSTIFNEGSTPNINKPTPSSAMQQESIGAQSRNRISYPSRFSSQILEEIQLDDDDDDDDEEEEDDERIYVLNKPVPTKESRYFRKIQNPAKENAEVIQVPEADEDVVYVQEYKSPANNSDRRNSTNYLNFDRYTPETARTPLYKVCKSRPLERRTMNSLSPKLSQSSSARFKTPIGLSRARLVSSRSEPFWKTQTKSANSGSGSAFQTRLPTTRMSESTRAAISKSFRLDDKKRYEELIKLSSSMYISKPAPLKSSQYNLSDARSIIERLSSPENSCRSAKSPMTEIPLNGSANKDKDEYDPATVASINLSDSDPEVVTSADDASTTSSIRVTPVNSIKILFKDKALTKDDWVLELTKKYKKMQMAKKSEVEDCTYHTNIISRFNRQQWKSTIEQSVKADMTLPINILEEAEEELELPELTNEQESLVDSALRPHPPNQVMIEKFNLSIHRRDIHTLAGLNWLNDEVINFYMNLIMERGQLKKDLPKVYGMNTFFYPRLLQSGHTGLKRWTRKVDIFSHDLMLVPVHLGVHWCMSIIDFRIKAIKYYDSMGGQNNDCCDALLNYLIDECMDKKRQKFDAGGWSKECVKKIPQQMNGSDCGMFSCMFAEFVSRDAPINFSQNDMPYLRRKMIYEIIKGELLM